MNMKALSIARTVSIVNPKALPQGRNETVVVLSQEVVDQIISLANEAESIEVQDAESNEQAGLVLSEATKLEKAVDEQRKQAKAPWADTAKAIDNAAKLATKPLDEIKASLKKKMAAYFDKVQAENAAKAAFASSTDIIEQAAAPKTNFTAVGKVKMWKVVGKVPVDYTMPDEKKIAAAVKAGILTTENAPWLSITEETQVKSTGR